MVMTGVSEQEYDIARALQSALRAKAPYVGIPIPGHAPLIFERAKLQRALTGVTPVYIGCEIISADKRALVIEGCSGPRCRTRLRAFSIPRAQLIGGGCERHRYGVQRWGNEIGRVQGKWKLSIREKPASVARDPLSKYRKELEKLEKQLAKLGERPKIVNPGVPYLRADRSLESHAAECETWRIWKAQKRLRGKVGALGAAARKGKMDARGLYAALRELLGDKMRTFSALTLDEKRRAGLEPRGGRYKSWEAPGFMDFCEPKTLWKTQPGIYRSWNGRPWTGGEDEADRWGAGRYAVVLEWSRERQELLSRIENVKIIMADAGAKAAR